MKRAMFAIAAAVSLALTAYCVLGFMETAEEVPHVLTSRIVYGLGSIASAIAAVVCGRQFMLGS